MSFVSFDASLVDLRIPLSPVVYLNLVLDLYDEKEEDDRGYFYFPMDEGKWFMRG